MNFVDPTGRMAGAGGPAVSTPVDPMKQFFADWASRSLDPFAVRAAINEQLSSGFDGSLASLDPAQRVPSYYASAAARLQADVFDPLVNIFAGIVTLPINAAYANYQLSAQLSENGERSLGQAINMTFNPFYLLAAHGTEAFGNGIGLSAGNFGESLTELDRFGSGVMLPFDAAALLPVGRAAELTVGAVGSGLSKINALANSLAVKVGYLDGAAMARGSSINPNELFEQLLKLSKQPPVRGLLTDIRVPSYPPITFPGAEVMPITDITTPLSRPVADGIKLGTLGAFSWEKYKPIVIDANGTILNGVTRFEAARNAGVTHLPVIRAP